MIRDLKDKYSSKDWITKANDYLDVFVRKTIFNKIFDKLFKKKGRGNKVRSYHG